MDIEGRIDALEEVSGFLVLCTTFLCSASTMIVILPLHDGDVYSMQPKLKPLPYVLHLKKDPKTPISVAEEVGA